MRIITLSDWQTEFAIRNKKNIEEGRRCMIPIISIVMPLYNAERFLEETLISVSKQTFQDYELICVNDGSEDNTVNIVQRFQKNDSRIRLLNNEKRYGAAVARNKGMQAANGKYLAFLDGDDIFDEELLMLSYEKAESTNAEIVMSEAMHVSSDRIYHKQSVKHSKKYTSKFCSQVLSVRDIKTCDFLIWSANPHTKLFRKEFIDQEALEFQNLSCENDTYFIIMAFFLANRIVRLDSDRVMIYLREHDTYSRISTNRDPMCVYYAMLKVRRALEERGIFEEMSELFFYRTFFFLCDGLRSARDTECKQNFYDFLVNEGFSNLFGSYDNGHSADQYIQNKIEEFIKLKLGSDWEKIFSIYEVFLENNMTEIADLFEARGGIKKRIGIWGTGENGRKLIAFCRRHNFSIEAVFDSDRTKCGNYWEGYYIKSPQNILEVNTIIATPNGAYEAIQETAMVYNKDVEVIDLNTYICCI